MRTAPSARLLLVLVVGLGGALAGCRSGSPLHSRYNNFRAYYNTYYNASKSLEDGESALERSAVTVDRNQLVAVFPVTGASASGGPFQDAIDKSAELLRNRPTSKWADDALLVIGKSYFYQRNFVGAEQKFRETMAAADLVEDRRLGDEARFWLGRTYAAADRFEEGVQVLEEGLADDGGDRRWRSRMQLALGELYARAGRWDEAAETLRAGAPEEGDADVAARSYVLLGQVEEHAERWDQAAQAYEEALRRRPAYELGYAAEVGRALVLGVEAGQTDDALAAIRRMRSDDKNYDRRGELALVEARLRAAAGDDARARALFRDVLYEPELNAAQVRGEAHYRLAEFYRDRAGDYVRASAHFDTAATALRAPAGDVRPTRGAIVEVADEARTYNALAATAREIAKADSLLILGDLSEEAFEARIAEIEAERRRIYAEEQRRLQEARTAQQFSDTGGLDFEGQTTANGARPPSTPAATSAANGGFLSYRVPASIQAGLIAFEQQWGDRPLVPNWRRRAAVQAGDVASARGVVGTEVPGGLGINEGPPPLDLSAIPRTPAKRAELVTELAGLRYQLANAFFLSLGRADTAAALYRAILQDTPDLPVAVRARYALAEIERTAGREDAARPLYESVAQADSAALGRASRARLGLEVEPEAVAVQTSAAYDAIRAVWRRGRSLAAATAFVALGDQDPEADQAPRAYLAAAIATVDWAGTDSLALVRPLPDSLVSSVLFVVADSVARADQAEAAAARAAEAARAAAEAAAPDSALSATPAEALDPEALDPEADVDVISDEEDTLLAARRRRAARESSAPDDDDLAASLNAAQAPGAQAAPVPDPPPVAPPLPVADSSSFTLLHHLRALAARYPGTPYADRATALAAELPALPVTATPDSLVAAAPPPAPADSTSAPVDSTATPADSTATPPTDDAPQPDERLAPPPAAPSPAADSLAAVADAGLRGEAPIDPTLGGVTWRVRTLSIPAEGVPMVRVLAGAGFRAAILRDVEGAAYVVAIGQFETAEQAQAVRDALPAWAQLRGEVVALEAFERTDVGTDDGP
ncbi:tetratricopeptide repeat protein [Rubrivirga sp.]|uniref:tetratricopeptide repeat protein n=1 Tax=Rubrivirga sp. TaxID=1885344 RepID=UPI003B52376A